MDNLPSVFVPFELDIDRDVLNAALVKAALLGGTLDEIVTNLLRAFVGHEGYHDVDEFYPPGDDPDLAPEPVPPNFCKPTYTIDQYVAYRSGTPLPIIVELEEFRAFAQGQGALKLAVWIEIWNAFCDMQDARDEAETQADALR